MGMSVGDYSTSRLPGHPSGCGYASEAQGIDSRLSYVALPTPNFRLRLFTHLPLM
jgi:hypothetical protein